MFKFISILAGLVGLLLLASPGFARDGWQSRPHVCDMPAGPRLERCDLWVSTVNRPDYRGASCCGDGDAFIADDFELGPNGELYAIITADYPEEAGYEQDDGTVIPPAFSVHRGMKILVPREKQNSAPEDANRSGHGVIFLLPSDGSVLCYFFPPLI